MRLPVPGTVQGSKLHACGSHKTTQGWKEYMLVHTSDGVVDEGDEVMLPGQGQAPAAPDDA